MHELPSGTLSGIEGREPVVRVVGPVREVRIGLID
jgi:hypothetical protein